MKRLTPHFTLEELYHSDTAIRMGIDNTPPPDIVPRLEVLAANLEIIREILGTPMIVSSGYRCEELERVVARKDFESWARSSNVPADDSSWPQYFARKQHPQGYAADWVSWAYGKPIDIIRTIVARGIAFDQLIQEGTWVHSSFGPAMRGIVLTAHFTKGEISYSKGI